MNHPCKQNIYVVSTIHEPGKIRIIHPKVWPFGESSPIQFRPVTFSCEIVIKFVQDLNQ